jgi:hypothetical protein
LRLFDGIFITIYTKNVRPDDGFVVIAKLMLQNVVFGVGGAAGRDEEIWCGG